MKQPVKAIAIIPARLGSVRFPRKVLAAETGRPMVLHVCEHAAKAKLVSKVVVATDADEVAEAVRSAGYEVVLTSPDHPNGTSRLAEAAAKLGLKPSAIVVNVQGDEPEIEPNLIDGAIEAASCALGWSHADPPVAVGTVASPLADADQIASPNIVKVVCGAADGPDGEVGIRRAMYFSRSAIPHDRDGDGHGGYLRHAGVYAYTRASLECYLTLAETPCELAERLEQLRWLEHSVPIGVAERDSEFGGIDTPEQYAAFVERWRARQSGL